MNIPSSPDPSLASGQTTSLTLIEKLQRRLPEAGRRLNELYGPLIHWWCVQRGVPLAETEDVRQDVYCVVVEKIAGFHRDKPGDTFRGWLRVITTNMILAHLRKSKSRPVAEGGTDANLRLQEIPALKAETDDPPELVEQQAQRALALVRGEFSPRDNHVFDLFVQEENTAKEVAAKVGMTPEAVRKVKSRILHRVRQELGDA